MTWKSFINYTFLVHIEDPPNSSLRGRVYPCIQTNQQSLGGESSWWKMSTKRGLSFLAIGNNVETQIVWDTIQNTQIMIQLD